MPPKRSLFSKQNSHNHTYNTNNAHPSIFGSLLPSTSRPASAFSPITPEASPAKRIKLVQKRGSLSSNASSLTSRIDQGDDGLSEEMLRRELERGEEKNREKEKEQMRKTPPIRLRVTPKKPSLIVNAASRRGSSIAAPNFGQLEVEKETTGTTKTPIKLKLKPRQSSAASTSLSATPSASQFTSSQNTGSAEEFTPEQPRWTPPPSLLAALRAADEEELMHTTESLQLLRAQLSWASYFFITPEEQEGSLKGLREGIEKLAGRELELRGKLGRVMKEEKVSLVVKSVAGGEGGVALDGGKGGKGGDEVGIVRSQMVGEGLQRKRKAGGR